MADDIQSNIRINVDTASAMDSIRLLQNQISAFHTQMAKMGAASAADSRNMQQNLINSINSTGAFTANMTKVRTTAEQFTHSLEKNKLSMGEYFRYAGGASKSFGKLFKSEFETINKVARERVKDLQTQYIKLGRDANGAMQAIKVRPLTLDMQNLGTKTQIAAQRQQLLNQLLKQGSTNLLNFGKNTQWAGRQLMVGFTIPLSIMGAAAMRAYKDIEEAAIRLKRVYGDLGTTNMETEKMVKEIQLLAQEYTKYGVAVKDSMDMAATAAATGKKGADLLAQVASSARLAVLGGVDQQMALKTTISLTDAFGVSTKQLSKDINFLNAVENQTVLSIEDMTIAIPKAAPVIQQLGGDVKDLAFFLTAMKEGGINASESANALKSGLASLINPTNTASKMLQGFGINLREIVQGNKGDVKKTVIDFAKALDTLDPLNRAKAIEQLFGKFQFARMSTLFKNVIEQGSQASEVLKLASQSSLELSMLAQRELSKIEQSPLYKFQKAIADFQAQLAPVGEQFMKALTPIINFGTDVLKNFNNLGEGVKGFIVKFVAIAGVVGPVLLMSFGLIANAVANVIKGFALMKDIFNKTGKSSLSLGEQVSYMTSEQIQAAAIASSLDQVHSKLKQTFTSEAAAVDMLTSAYQRSVAAQKAFNVPITPRGPLGNAPVRKYANGGIINGPGTGTSDSILAMVSNGEAIIPAASVARNPGMVRQLVSGNIPGFVKGAMFDDPYDLSNTLGIKKSAIFGKKGYNPLNAQMHATDAIDAGHVAASAFRTAEEFTTNMLASMKRMGATQAEIDKATKASIKHFDTQAEFLRKQGKTEQEIANFKYQTYGENVIAQPSFLNNKGSGMFSSSEIGLMKGFYKPGAEGATAFSNLQPHLKALGLSEKETNQVLIKMADNLHTSLSKVESTAKFNLDDLSRLTTEAQDQAVSDNRRAKAALEEIRKAEFTARSITSHARPALSPLSYHATNVAETRLQQSIKALGLTSSPYSPGGKPTMTASSFEQANSPYNPRTMKIAMDQIRNLGAEGVATVNNMLRQYKQLGVKFVPEMVATVDRMLGPELMAKIETTVARNVGTISTSMANGVEKGFNAATQRNSPPKKLIQAGADSGTALVTGARSQIDDAAVAGKVIGATITQNAMGGSRVMSDGIITPGATQAQQVAIVNGKRGRVTSVGDVVPGQPVQLVDYSNPGSGSTMPMSGVPYGPQPATKFQQSRLGQATTKYNNFFTSAGAKVTNMDPGKFQGRMFGGSMVAGLASMVLPGPLGQVAGTASMVMGVGGMFKNLGPVVGKLIPVFGKLIPFVGIAITAFEAFDKIVLPLIRKNADSFNALADTLNITKDKIKGINDFFGTEGKLSGVRASVVASGTQTGEQASIAKQFQESEQFKANFEESANKMQSLSKQEFERAMQGMAMDLAGQGYDPEAVKAIIDAIAIQAKQSSVNIVPELFSLKNPETRSLMDKNVKSIFADTSKNIKDLAGQNFGDFNANDVQRTAKGDYDNFFGERPLFSDPETVSKLKANVSELSSYMSGLSAQFANGEISVKEYNLQYQKLISLAQQQPGTSGIDALRAAFVLLNAEIGGALSKLNDIQFAAVSDAILAGVVSTQESLDAIYYGTEAQKQEQTKNYTEAAKQLKENRDKKTALQKQITGLESASGDIAKTEQAINDKYDKRIAQIEKIKKLNEQIAKSQQGQLTLAEALNRGDIAAAARAAIDVQNNDIQASLENQQDGLNEARKAELAPLKDGQEANTTAIKNLTTKIEKLNTDGVTVKNVEDAGPVLQSQQGNDPMGYLGYIGAAAADASIPGVIKNIFDLISNPQTFFKNKLQQYLRPGSAVDRDGNVVDQRPAAVKPYTGGHITGPGTGTSDSIPAMLSNGEYVIRANAVKTIGIGTLDKLNQADRLGFAAGGMVDKFKKKKPKPKPYTLDDLAKPITRKDDPDWYDYTHNFFEKGGIPFASPYTWTDANQGFYRGQSPSNTNNVRDILDVKDGKVSFTSVAGAIKYYKALILSRREAPKYINKILGDKQWTGLGDKQQMARSNSIYNRMYGNYNGLDKAEAKVLASAMTRLWGKDSVKAGFKTLGLSPDLLTNKRMFKDWDVPGQQAWDKYTRNNDEFVPPMLSPNTPKYAKGGMVGCPCGRPGCPGCGMGYAMGGMVGYEDGGYVGGRQLRMSRKAYLQQQAAIQAAAIEQIKAKAERDKLYKQGGFQGFEAGANSFGADLMNGPLGGLFKGMGETIEGNPALNFLLSTLSLPVNLIGGAAKGAMNTGKALAKGDFLGAATAGFRGVGDAFASTYGNIFDKENTYKSQFEVIAENAINDNLFGAKNNKEMAALARIIGGGGNLAFDPLNYVGIGLAAKAAKVGTLGKNIKTGLGIRGAKNALKAAAVSTGADVSQVGKLTPALAFNLSDEALAGVIKDNFYGNMRVPGMRSSTKDSLENRILVEQSMMGISPTAPASKTPAYGFLTTREDVPSYYNSIMGGMSPRSREQAAIDYFNRLINPESRYLGRYGENTIKLKPDALGRATVSMGDTLSIWDQAIRLGKKIPKVDKLSSLFSTFPALSGKLGSTQKMMNTEIRGIKTPTAFPYIEAHLPGGFTLEDIESIMLNPTDRFGPNAVKIAEDLAQRKAALEAMFESMGIKGIKITENEGIKIGKETLEDFYKAGGKMHEGSMAKFPLPTKGPRAPRTNPFASMLSNLKKKPKPITYDTMFGPKTRGQSFDELGIDSVAREREFGKYINEDELFGLKRYVESPYTLHGQNTYHKEKVIEAILKNKLRVDSGTEIVRVANVHDMKILKNMKPGQSVILDQFLSMANKNVPGSDEFVSQMMKGKIDTGGRGTGNYPLIKFNVKTDVPGINDINNIIPGLSNVSDGLLAPGVGMKLVKVSKSKNGEITYHVDLGTDINAKYGFNQKNRINSSKEMLNYYPSGHKYNIMHQKELGIIKSEPIFGKNILDFIRSQGGKYSNGGMIRRYAQGGFVMPSPEPIPTQFAKGGMVYAARGGMLMNGKMYGGFSNGGMVPKYFAEGGYSMGTDTVPAMLTPGEFVIKKSAVDRIGTSTLTKINGYADGGLVGGASAALGDSVYNSNTYEINVNVSSNSNPDQIANAVMSRIKQIDNGRVRGLGR